jgi:hypothetical protein
LGWGNEKLSGRGIKNENKKTLLEDAGGQENKLAKPGGGGVAGTGEGERGGLFQIFDFASSAIDNLLRNLQDPGLVKDWNKSWNLALVKASAPSPVKVTP